MTGARKPCYAVAIVDPLCGIGRCQTTRRAEIVIRRNAVIGSIAQHARDGKIVATNDSCAPAQNFQRILNFERQAGKDNRPIRWNRPRSGWP